MNFNYQHNSRSPFGGIGAILFLVLFVVGLFYLFSAFTKFLYMSWVPPALLVGALVIRHQVVTKYVKNIQKMLQTVPALGIGAIALTFLLYPFVALHLFLKSLRKPSPYSQQRPQNPFFSKPLQEEKHNAETFTEFEDLTEQPKPKEKRDDNDYDEFFEL